MTETVEHRSSRERDATARALRVAAVVAAAVTLALALFVPIYHDEVGWKILQARLWRDGGVNIHQLPTCASSFATAPPFYMRPFRWLDAIVYGDLRWPLELRVLGIATQIAWLVLLMVGLGRAVDPAVDRRLLFGGLFAGLGLGTLPLLLVLNRPEQLLLLGATAFAFVPFLCGGGARAGWRPWLRAALLVAAATGLFAVHAKAVFLLPVVLVGIAGALERRPARWLALVVATAVALASAQYWQQRFACADDPSVAAKLRVGLALDELAAGRIGELVRNALEGETTRNAGFLRQIELGSDGWNWLQPASPLRRSERWLNRALHLAGLALGAAVALVAIAAAVRAARSRRLDRRAAITLALAAPLGALFLLEQRRAAYEAGFLIALAAVVVALNARVVRRRGVAAVVRFAILALMLFGLGSQAVLWRRFAPRVAVVRAADGYLAGQPLSFSPFGSERVRSEVLAAAARCGIDPSQRLEALVLDDVSYPAFQSSWRPLHVFYLMPPWGESIVDLDRFLTERRSSGVVVGCHVVPSGLRARAVATGAFCCLPAFAE